MDDVQLAGLAIYNPPNDSWRYIMSQLGLQFYILIIEDYLTTLFMNNKDKSTYILWIREQEVTV